MSAIVCAICSQRLPPHFIYLLGWDFQKKNKMKLCLQKMIRLIFDLAKAAFKVLVLLVYAAKLAPWLNGASLTPVPRSDYTCGVTVYFKVSQQTGNNSYSLYKHCNLFFIIYEIFLHTNKKQQQYPTMSYSPGVTGVTFTSPSKTSNLEFECVCLC